MFSFTVIRLDEFSVFENTEINEIALTTEYLSNELTKRNIIFDVDSLELGSSISLKKRYEDGDTIIAFITRFR